MTRLILVRHAEVVRDPDAPTDTWLLSAPGRVQATALSRLPLLADVGMVCTSPEPKAGQTAAAVAGNRPVETVPELRELDRSSLGWMGSGDDYARIVTEILLRPDQSVHGCEPAAEAQDRVVRAVDGAVHQHPDVPLAIVSHGIVLTLLLSWIGGTPPNLKLWAEMRFPDVAAVEWEAREVTVPFGRLPVPGLRRNVFDP